TPATFTVSLSNPSVQTVTVNYATAGFTATAGSDFTSVSGTLTFNPGQTTKTVTVSVLGDTTWERDETFRLNLSNNVGAAMGDSQGIGTILNDDVDPTRSEITVAASGSASDYVGDGTFTQLDTTSYSVRVARAPYTNVPNTPLDQRGLLE